MFMCMAAVMSALHATAYSDAWTWWRVPACVQNILRRHNIVKYSNVIYLLLCKS
jgi:hypothetical protein